MYTFQIEKFNNSLFEEMYPLGLESAKEVYSTKNSTLILDNMYYGSVDEEYYQLLSDTDKLISFTLRKNGKMIGYYVLILSNHQQSKDILIANCESLYIIKDERNQVISKSFIKYCENELVKRGVSLLNFGINVNMKAMRRFLRINGFKEDEIIYNKELK